MERKKVLIITYYWPPAGGISVQRWLRFVASLRNYGWEPVIYTAKNAAYPINDETLLEQVPENIKVYRHKVPEPNNWMKYIFFWKKDKDRLIYKNQQQGGSRKSLLSKAMWFIRGNFMIPDARALWIKPSVKYLRKIVLSEKIDAIVSTGPPHSTHLIAKKLKHEFNLPWLSDFRDPWTSMDYLKEMFLTARTRKKHARLEKEVVVTANAVVVVGPTMYREFYDKYGVKSHLIQNGYTPLPSANNPRAQLDKKFSIIHTGSFLFARNCDDFWEVLAEIAAADSVFASHLQLKMIGNLAPNVTESLTRNGLNKYLLKIDYVEQKKVHEHLQTAQVLLLPIDRISNAEFVITGKLYEYLQARRPVLVIGPMHGDAAHIILESKAGYCCSFNDKTCMRETVLKMYRLFLENQNNVAPVNVEQYASEQLTKKLASVLDTITKK